VIEGEKLKHYSKLTDLFPGIADTEQPTSSSEARPVSVILESKLRPVIVVRKCRQGDNYLVVPLTKATKSSQPSRGDREYLEALVKRQIVERWLVFRSRYDALEYDSICILDQIQPISRESFLHRKFHLKGDDFEEILARLKRLIEQSSRKPPSP